MGLLFFGSSGPAGCPEGAELTGKAAQRSHCLRPETRPCSLRILAEGTAEVEQVQSRREGESENPKAAPEPSRGAQGGTGDHTPQHLAGPSGMLLPPALLTTSPRLPSRCPPELRQPHAWQQPPWCLFCSCKCALLGTREPEPLTASEGVSKCTLSRECRMVPPWHCAVPWQPGSHWHSTSRHPANTSEAPWTPFYCV